MEDLNVYEKLQMAKTLFHCQPLKKTGRNKFSAYDYFELGDILPAIMKALNEVKAVTTVTFEQDVARLRFIDTKSKDFIEFTCPTAECEVKGCNKVQGLGAMQTYIRRYLYVMAFDVIENDIIDSGEQAKEPSKSTNSQSAKAVINCLSEKDCVSFMEEMKAKGVGGAKIIKALESFKHKRLGEVTLAELEDFKLCCLS